MSTNYEIEKSGVEKGKIGIETIVLCPYVWIV